MEKKSSIFKRTLLSILIPEIILFGIIAFFGLKQTIQLISKFNQERVQSLNNQIEGVLEYQELTMRIAEEKLNNRIENVFHQLQFIHSESTLDLSKLNLQLAHSKTNMDPVREHFYILDKDGIIINSTFKSDIGFNTFDLGDEYKMLLQRVNQDTLIHLNDVSNGRLLSRQSKTGYQSIYDGQYILAVIGYSKQADSIVDVLKLKVNAVRSVTPEILSLDLVYYPKWHESFNEPTRTFDSSTYQNIQKAYSLQKDSVFEIDSLNFYTSYRNFYNPQATAYNNGVLICRLDKTWMTNLLSSNLQQDLILFLSIICLGGVVFFNTRRITKPILNLTQTAQRIESGELDARVIPKGNDELAILSNQFNHMVQQLHENQLEIEAKHQEITSSINYAKRIQKAILPQKKRIQLLLPNSFVFYLPKDIVAGDFYWLEPFVQTSNQSESVKNGTLFSVADCTGHGVPGALVSVVCHNALNRAVREFGLNKPSDILDKTRTLVLEEFEKSDDNVQDGMDIALCAIYDNVLEYAGANNSLYIVRDGTVMETKADKQPIGKFDQPKPFQNHTIELKEEDVIYLFSDGYADQFGGPKDRKFGYKRFRELFIEISVLPLEQQKEKIETTFNDWMIQGIDGQIDDICIWGFKFNSYDSGDSRTHF